MNRLPVVLALTGASGAPYGVRLLEVLATYQVPVWLMISTHGWRLLAEECGITLIGFLRDGSFNIYTRPDRIAT